MDRVLLVKDSDLSLDNLLHVLLRAENLKKYHPELLDGWYLCGICYKKMGKKHDALYNLYKAQSIAPASEIDKEIDEIQSKLKDKNFINIIYNFKKSQNILLNIMVLMFTVSFVWLLVIK